MGLLPLLVAAASTCVVASYSSVLDGPFKARSALMSGGADPATCAAWLWKEGPGAFRLFRNRFVSDGTPARIHVSADMRYVLRLDGRRICRGPDRGEVASWTYRTLDLELSMGEHVLEAVVRHGGNPPLAQTTYRAGFILSAEGVYDAKLTTGKGGWKVATVGEVEFAGPDGGAFGVGLPDLVKGTAPEFVRPPEAEFAEPEVVRAPYPVSAYCHTLPGWQLVESKLPPQLDRPFALPGFVPTTVPARTERDFTFDLGGYFCVYPEFATKGGRGAEIRVSWAENPRKLAQGFTDTFLPDGGENRFGTSWFRSGRCCRFAVKTGDEPLELTEATLFETRYPLAVSGCFSADDGSLAQIGALCRRGLELCSHETTFDCPYYEQLQYLGDSRVQFFAHFALTDDDRLMKRAIEIFELSRRADGLMPMNAPVEGPASESPTYTMCYPLILADYARFRSDRQWLRRRLPGLAHVMEGLAAHENADGLLEDLPGWCFIDWAKWAESGVPGAGPEAGRLSACENLLYLLSLEAAADVEEACGDRSLADLFRARAARTKAAVLRTFWSEDRGAIADEPGKERFSEHALALSVLADVLDPVRRERTRKLLLEDGSLTRASVYFSHYVFSAYFRLGAAEAFLKRLDLWRDYLRRGHLTPLEMPEPTRSECHAWGAHPVYHFAAGLAGITPSAPFFGRVRVAPQPGSLREIDCTMPHPRGRVSVALRFDGAAVEGRVTLPDGVDGEFVWRGRSVALHGGENVVNFGNDAASTPECPTWINVAPLLGDRVDELVADNRWLFENTLVDGAAFMLTLTPEGSPAFDKAGAYMPVFRRVQEGLKGARGRCGVLFQATVGHGWTPDSPAPGQRFVGRGGGEAYVFCPLDDAFIAYLRGQADQIAAARPDFFMIDDDTRFITGRDGCFCPLHLVEMHRRTGRTFTREALVEALAQEPDLARIYDRLLEDTVARVVQTVREAFDRVDPAIPGSFCCCFADVRHASRLARLAAAKGQRPVLRLNNGRYCSETQRDVGDWLHKTALELAAIAPGIAVLDEPDTCPQNRYSMSAADLHAHIALSLVEGCRGGKIWITRTCGWEPESGVAYRRMLSERSGFCRRLAELEIEPDGVKCPLPAEPHFSITSIWRTASWGGAAFARMGVAYANAKRRLPVAALTGDDAAMLSDADIRELLKGGLLLDGDGALELTRRGFASLVGAVAEPWAGPVASFEALADGTRINTKIDAVRLAKVDPAAERLSVLMHRSAALSEDAFEVGVGSCRFRNALGGEVIALAARLPSNVNLGAFHFYNQVRKRQVVGFLRRLGSTAPYYPGDGEVLLRWGRAKDGSRVLVAFVCGHDGLDSLPVVFPSDAPSAAEMLGPDGVWSPVRIRREGEATVFDAPLRFLDVAVFRLAP